MAKKEPLVHYISPFGSPAWMTRELAEAYLKEDDERWVWMQEVSRETGCDVLGETARRVGGPRIEVVK